MKAYKITMVFSVLVFVIVGSMWALDVFNNEQAKSYAGKLIAVVLILGLGSAAMMNVFGSGNKSQNTNQKDKPGPKF